MRWGAGTRRRAAIAAVTVCATVSVGCSVGVTAGAATAGHGSLSRLMGAGKGRTQLGPWDDGWRKAPAGSAPTLNGGWAPFNRCPVDNPTMLATEGVLSDSVCLALDSPGGIFKVGGFALQVGESNTQFGLIEEGLREPELTFKLISPDGGGMSIAPIVIPGALPALVCPSTSPRLKWVCSPHPGEAHGRSTDVVASVQPAGEPSNFNLDGVTSSGTPVVTQPVKVHLQSELLGPDCYIGSDSEPIVMQFRVLVEAPSFEDFRFESFKPDGERGEEGASMMGKLGVLDETVGDESFAVPGVSGCGPRGSLDEAIDHGIGLPSPSGQNALVLNEASAFLTLQEAPEDFAPNAGKVMSEWWHSAVVATQHGHGGH